MRVIVAENYEKMSSLAADEIEAVARGLKQQVKA